MTICVELETRVQWRETKSIILEIPHFYVFQHVWVLVLWTHQSIEPTHSIGSL